jgi:hypothetical protein
VLFSSVCIPVFGLSIGSFIALRYQFRVRSIDIGQMVPSNNCSYVAFSLKQNAIIVNLCSLSAVIVLDLWKSKCQMLGFGLAVGASVKSIMLEKLPITREIPSLPKQAIKEKKNLPSIKTSIKFGNTLPKQTRLT